jgi:hypothetical protein
MLEPRAVATSFNRLFVPDTSRLADDGAGRVRRLARGPRSTGGAAGLIERGDARVGVRVGRSQRETDGRYQERGRIGAVGSPI